MTEHLYWHSMLENGETFEQLGFYSSAISVVLFRYSAQIDSTKHMWLTIV